jgi:hypothetical protein
MKYLTILLLSILVISASASNAELKATLTNLVNM